MSKDYAIRRIRYQGSLMINICDKDLLGKVIREGRLQVNISKDYFCESYADEEEITNALKECSIANLVGEKCIKKALELRLASELSIRRISGVPFLMIFKFTSNY